MYKLSKLKIKLKIRGLWWNVCYKHSMTSELISLALQRYITTRINYQKQTQATCPCVRDVSTKGNWAIEIDPPRNAGRAIACWYRPTQLLFIKTTFLSLLAKYVSCNSPHNDVNLSFNVFIDRTNMLWNYNQKPRNIYRFKKKFDLML